MGNELQAAKKQRPRPAPVADDWQQALARLEQGLAEATQAAQLLARILGAEHAKGTASSVKPSAPGEDEPADVQPAAERPPAPAAGLAPDAFERIWERMEREREERRSTPPEVRRGLDLLPHHYLITVEDRRGKVNVVPLHRALRSLPGVRDITLVSYANGVPIVSLQSEGEVDPERLGAAVSEAMARPCEVIPQENGRFYLRLAA